MPSHTVTPATSGAHEPKRRRGHLRVAAILAAGIEVFIEKGYDAATMTEIAARSGTAIGSLYRFFPSKEALADALLLAYVQSTLAGLAELGKQAAAMTLDELADALVDFMLALQSQRNAAQVLIETRGGSDAQRAEFRTALRDALAQILRKALPGLSRTKYEVMAALLLHLLKAVPASGQERPAARALWLLEIRTLIRLYCGAAVPPA